MRMRLAAGVAAGLCALAAVTGCGAGSGGDQRQAVTVSVWAAEALRDVLPAEVEGIALRPTFASPEALTTRLSRGERPDVLLVDGETFPVWDLGRDRLAGSRIVARDELEFVARKPRRPGAAVGQPGAQRIAYPSEGTAGRLALALVAAGSPAFQAELPDSSAVLQALRDNRRLSGLVLRSAVRRARDRGDWNTQPQSGLGITEVFVQAAYAQERPEAAPVVRWLGGPEARKRFGALGLDGPGPNATVRDCTRDAC